MNQSQAMKKEVATSGMMSNIAQELSLKIARLSEDLHGIAQGNL